MRLIAFAIALFWATAGICTTTYAYTASYYTKASCRHEGTSGIMANGKELKDEGFTCASWDYPFGTRLLVTNFDNRKAVFVTVTDRGPNKKLYRKGRIIDLSKAAFNQIACLERGVITCEVKEVK